MNKLIFLFPMSLLIASGAQASWESTYIGLNGGYAWNQSNLQTKVEDPGTYFLPAEVAAIDAAGASHSANSSNFLGGGQLGYRWQYDDWVYGLELDAAVFISDTTHEVTTGTFTIMESAETSWLATVRPQIGFALDDLLVYITGGVAVTDLEAKGEFIDTSATGGVEKSSESVAKIGWTVGAGAELAFDEAWSFGAQYLYTSFGNVSTNGTLSNSLGETAELEHEADLTSSILRFVINYHFAI